MRLSNINQIGVSKKQNGETVGEIYKEKYIFKSLNQAGITMGNKNVDVLEKKCRTLNIKKT